MFTNTEGNLQALADESARRETGFGHAEFESDQDRHRRVDGVFAVVEVGKDDRIWQQPRFLAQSYKPRSGIMEWLTTVDHKKIGLLYIVMAFLFFLSGGIMALFIRLELAQPGAQIVSAQTYNMLFTMHGTTMIFLFVIPMFAGFGNYLVPLMIGARDMAFPRLNAFSFWLALGGGIIMYSSMLVIGPEAGWTGYSPLANSIFSKSPGTDLWIMGLVLIGTSSLLGAINFIVTILNMRTPGMTMTRIPLFCWSILTTSVMILASTPVLAGALLMLFFDRNFGTTFFSGPGSDSAMYQHMFWFYSHPAVYIMVLPAMGIVSEVLPVFSRKPIFGYKAIAYSTAAIALFGFLVWAHHMFTTGLAPVLKVFFMAATMAIAVPTGVKIFNWIATMWGGRLRFDTALLNVFGFLTMFVIGGISGVFNAVVPIDYQVQDTYFVVAHLHYVLFGGSVFGIFAGLYYWIPKIHRLHDERDAGQDSILDHAAGLQPDLLPDAHPGVGRHAAPHLRLRAGSRLGAVERPGHDRVVAHRAVGVDLHHQLLLQQAQECGRG